MSELYCSCAWAQTLSICWCVSCGTEQQPWHLAASSSFKGWSEFVVFVSMNNRGSESVSSVRRNASIICVNIHGYEVDYAESLKVTFFLTDFKMSDVSRKIGSHAVWILPEESIVYSNIYDFSFLANRFLPSLGGCCIQCPRNHTYSSKQDHTFCMFEMRLLIVWQLHICKKND